MTENNIEQLDLSQPEPAKQDVPVEEPKKRGPGRPRKNTSLEQEDLSKASTEEPKKRGPKPGGTSKKKAGDLESLAKNIVGIHQIASMVTGFPELSISDEEGTALAKGVTSVCEEYGLQLSGKTGAFLQLLGAASMVYGPRAFMIYQRIEAMKAEQAKPVN